MIGSTVSQYRILEKLGEGGMGIVYKALDTKLDRIVALKFLPHHLTGNDAEKARFLQEAKAAASLNHPNVCAVIDLQEHNGQQFIIMEYIDGVTVRQKVPVQNVHDALQYALQIGEALQAAHARGIVHRDVKCENIMVTPDGRIKVMDFGLAKLKGSLKLTRTSSTVGTLAYMSPEQIQGEEVDARADLFSLGVVLFEMLSGKFPFRGEHEAAMMYSILNEEPESVTKCRPDLQANIPRIIAKALQKDPRNRYQTAADFVKDAREAMTPNQTQSDPELTSIAVLSFGNMSPDKDQDYLCEGLADEIINALSKLKTLRVSSRTSAFAFKGRQLDIREIGAKLNVQTVLEGSVRKSGNRLRITAQLINVENGYHLWSERYDRELRDVFEIQDEITENVVGSLKLVLTDTEKKSLEVVPTPSVEAYEYYLRGRRLQHQHRSSYDEGIRMFLRAIEIDPDYTLAYCGMADSYAWRYMYKDSSETNLHESENASRKAIALDPNSAEAHTSLGLAISLKKRYDEAAREFEKAIKLNPQLFEAYYYYGRMSFAKGDFPRAAKMFEEAMKVHPEDYQVPALLAAVYRSLNDRTKLEAILHTAVLKAERHLELDPEDARAYCLGAGALFSLGQIERGEEWIVRSIAIEPDNVGTNYNIACLYAQMHNADKAFEYLRNAVKFGFAHREWIEHDSDFDPVRGDPRFQELLRQIK